MCCLARTGDIVVSETPSRSKKIISVRKAREYKGKKITEAGSVNVTRAQGASEAVLAVHEERAVAG